MLFGFSDFTAAVQGLGDALGKTSLRNQEVLVQRTGFTIHYRLRQVPITLTIEQESSIPSIRLGDMEYITALHSFMRGREAAAETVCMTQLMKVRKYLYATESSKLGKLAEPVRQGVATHGLVFLQEKALNNGVKVTLAPFGKLRCLAIYAGCNNTTLYIEY